MDMYHWILFAVVCLEAMALMKSRMQLRLGSLMLRQAAKIVRQSKRDLELANTTIRVLKERSSE